MTTKKEYYVTVQFAQAGGATPKPRPKNVPWARPEMEVPDYAKIPMQAPFVMEEGRIGLAPPPQSQKGYVYVAELTEDEVKEINEFGRYAVVDSPSSGLVVVLVCKADELDFSEYNGQYKHIVQLVDTGPYEEKKEKAARRIAIRKHLARLAEEAKERIKVEELLSGNPEAQALFDELKAL